MIVLYQILSKVSPFFNITEKLVIIKPKQPFLDWLKTQPDWDNNITLDDLRSDCNTLLIPEYDSDEEAMQYIEQNFEAIFELELFGWYTDESIWPENLTLYLFRRWFDI